MYGGRKRKAEQPHIFTKLNGTADAKENEKENRGRKYCDDKQNPQPTCHFIPNEPIRGSMKCSLSLVHMNILAFQRILAAVTPNKNTSVQHWLGGRKSENEGVKQKMLKNKCRTIFRASLISSYIFQSHAEYLDYLNRLFTSFFASITSFVWPFDHFLRLSFSILLMREK